MRDFIAYVNKSTDENRNNIPHQTNKKKRIQSNAFGEKPRIAKSQIIHRKRIKKNRNNIVYGIMGQVTESMEQI